MPQPAVDVARGRFHETPRNLRITAGEIVHRPRCELRRVMSSCHASQRFVKSTTGPNFREQLKRQNLLRHKMS